MCNGLSRRGHEVTVLAPTGDLAADLEASLVPLPAGRGPAALLTLARELRRVISTHRPDIVHVHHRRHALVAQAVARGSSSVVVEHAHSSFHDKKLLSFRADHVLAVGSSVRRDIVQHYGRPAERVALLSNAVADPGPGPSAVAGDDAVLRLVAVGRLDALKDPGFFDALVGELRARGHRVEASWAGDGDADFRARTAGWTNVEWLGQLPETQVPALLRTAHALVLTSTQEGLPLVALQALAVGTPVLARRAGSVGDAVADGRAGAVWSELLTPQETVQWLDERRLLDAGHLRTLRPDSRRHYEENFTVDAMVDKLESLYQQWVAR